MSEEEDNNKEKELDPQELNRDLLEEVIENEYSEEDYDEEDDEYEGDYVSAFAFEQAISDINIQFEIHDLYLDELAKKADEHPQKLKCYAAPDNPEKTCIADYNIGISPEYCIEFVNGNDTKTQPNLVLMVDRRIFESAPSVQYQGKIIGLPDNLESGTQVILRTKQIGENEYEFEFVGLSLKTIIKNLEFRINELEKQMAILEKSIQN